MCDDKQVLILASAQDELELDMELDLSLTSGSPYCSTTTPMTCDIPPSYSTPWKSSSSNPNPKNSSKPHVKLHFNEFSPFHSSNGQHSSTINPSSRSSHRKNEGKKLNFRFPSFGNNPRLSQQISTISNFLHPAGQGHSRGQEHRHPGSPDPGQNDQGSNGFKRNHPESSPSWAFPTSTFTSRLSRRLWRTTKWIGQVWQFHWRMIISSVLTVISSAGCLISFPIYLEQVTEDERSDGFSACFAISSILVILFLLIAFSVKLVYLGTGAGTGIGFRSKPRQDRSRGTGGSGSRSGSNVNVESGARSGSRSRSRSRGIRVPGQRGMEEEFSVIRPSVSWKSIIKIGFSVGLSVLSICSAWEDNKVLCNYQDPLLGLVIIFAIITHAVSKWRHLGFKRAFALLAVAAGVFVSVDYMLVDQHRCRGYYYSHPPKDKWTWKVHLVWTLAFVVAIWLWTVAMFCLETCVSTPQIKNRTTEETNAVKMTFLRVKSTDGQNQESATSSTLKYGQSGGGSRGEAPENDNDNEPDLFSPSPRSHLYQDPYSEISYITVFGAVFWFHISTWAFIASLFWTEFIPGFGIGKGSTVTSFLWLVWMSFERCLHDPCSWILISSLFVFSQSFTYLVLLLRSSIIAICITCLGFPILGMWWSFFQIQVNVFTFMPVFSGELICAFLGFPLICFGSIYMFKLDILNPNRIVISL